MYMFVIFMYIFAIYMTNMHGICYYVMYVFVIYTHRNMINYDEYHITMNMNNEYIQKN